MQPNNYLLKALVYKNTAGEKRNHQEKKMWLLPLEQFKFYIGEVKQQKRSHSKNTQGKCKKTKDEVM